MRLCLALLSLRHRLTLIVIIMEYHVYKLSSKLIKNIEFYFNSLETEKEILHAIIEACEAVDIIMSTVYEHEGDGLGFYRFQAKKIRDALWSYHKLVQTCHDEKSILL